MWCHWGVSNPYELAKFDYYVKLKILHIYEQIDGQTNERTMQLLDSLADFSGQDIPV